MRVYNFIFIYLFIFDFNFNFVRPLDGLPLCPLNANAFKEWENWARIQLMSSGSDLFGKTYNLQVLISALVMYSPFRFLPVCRFNSFFAWFMMHCSYIGDFKFLLNSQSWHNLTQFMNCSIKSSQIPFFFYWGNR